MLTEKLFEDILVKYPELIEENLVLLGRQVTHFSKRIDLLFEDRFKEKLIIELKINNLQRNALSQVMEYEGFILSEKDPSARVMIIANRIPLNLKKAMDHHGIEYKEITQGSVLKFLEKNDLDLLSRVMAQKNQMIPIVKKHKSHQDTLARALDDIISQGGTWEHMVAKANEQSIRLGFKTRFSPSVIRAHIRFREMQGSKNSKDINLNDSLKKAKTLRGVEYRYEGSLSTGLTIYLTNSVTKISREIIEKIKAEITKRSPVLMGACRDKPALNSIGFELRLGHDSPQNLSYVIPILIEEGFCTASKNKPFIITKI